jgi:hypothetical protein
MSIAWPLEAGTPGSTTNCLDDVPAALTRRQKRDDNRSQSAALAPQSIFNNAAVFSTKDSANEHARMGGRASSDATPNIPSLVCRRFESAAHELGASNCGEYFF